MSIGYALSDLKFPNFMLLKKADRVKPENYNYIRNLQTVVAILRCPQDRVVNRAENFRPDPARTRREPEINNMNRRARDKDRDV